MSSINYPCNCRIEYDINDVVINIQYCPAHQHIRNSKLSLDDNALDLEDEIFTDCLSREIDDDRP